MTSTCNCKPNEDIYRYKCVPGDSSFEFCPMKLHTIAFFLDNHGDIRILNENWEDISEMIESTYDLDDEDSETVINICKDNLEINGKSNRVDIYELYANNEEKALERIRQKYCDLGSSCSPRSNDIYAEANKGIIFAKMSLQEYSSYKELDSSSSSASSASVSASDSE